uniref:Uncharacterized protein n=1 Tax=Steinernema glaseri TaxID=37863 RepID=A0A1I7Z8I7_9BILA
MGAKMSRTATFFRCRQDQGESRRDQVRNYQGSAERCWENNADATIRKRWPAQTTIPQTLRPESGRLLSHCSCAYHRSPDPYDLCELSRARVNC